MTECPYNELDNMVRHSWDLHRKDIEYHSHVFEVRWEGDNQFLEGTGDQIVSILAKGANLFTVTK